jgi:hypothetical protein
LNLALSSLPIGLANNNPLIKTDAFSGTTPTASPTAPAPETKKDEPKVQGKGFIGDVINTFVPLSRTTTQMLGLGQSYLANMYGGCEDCDGMCGGRVDPRNIITNEPQVPMVDPTEDEDEDGERMGLEQELEDTIYQIQELTNVTAQLISENTLRSLTRAQNITRRIRELVIQRDNLQRQLGNGGGVDGLYNDEIEKIADKMGFDVPVVAVDQMDKIVDMISPGTKEMGFIINVVPSTSDGSGRDGFRSGHWRAVYINNADDLPSIEFFDPLGDAPEKQLIDGFRKITNKMDNDKLFLFKENMIKRQADTTDTCGHFALKFLEDRFNGVPWPEATGFDKCMNQSSDGEREIMKHAKRYEGYL